MAQLTAKPERYLALLTHLVRARRDAGGQLSAASESRFIEKLDDLWWSMTAEEHAAVDRELAARERQIA